MKRRLKPLTVEALQGADASRPTSARSKTSRTSGATGGVLPVGGKKKEAKGKKEEKKKAVSKIRSNLMNPNQVAVNNQMTINSLMSSTLKELSQDQNEPLLPCQDKN